MKTKFWIIIIVIFATSATILVSNHSLSYPPVTVTTQADGVSLGSEEIQQIIALSKDILRHLPTFGFDGIESSIKVNYIHTTQKDIRVDLEFTSENIGYGVRDFVPLMKHPTNHSVRIYLEPKNYDVISVGIDRCWDALKQQWDEDWGYSGCRERPYYVTPPNYISNYYDPNGPLRSHFSGMKIFQEFERIYPVYEGDFDARFRFVGNFHNSNDNESENWGYFQYQADNTDKTVLLIARIHKDMTVFDVEFWQSKYPLDQIEIKENDIVYYTSEDHVWRSVYSNPDILILKTEKEILDYFASIS